MFLCAFAWPHGGHVEKCRVFVFLLGRPTAGNVEKNNVFVCFLGKVEKCSVFVCFGFLCVFARSHWGNVEKCRVCRKV